jgi:hypothetical protein
LAENIAMASTPMPAREPDTSSAKLAFPLQSGEQILQISRRHWWFLWPKMIMKTVALLGPIIVLWFIFDIVGAYDGVGQQIFWLVSILWAIWWAIQIYFTWYQYHNDVWAITNQRIVDVFKRNPFNLRVSSADLVNVQDISIERVGIIPTTLDFGDIVCQTSGSRDVFRLAGLPDPRQTQALIDQERDRERMRVRGA